MAGGKAGVERALQMLTKEFTDTMKLLGANNVSELDESLVSIRPKYS
jgi:isopentenyl diphosphate isomerase/L-lactate dehydrogenase-like FMN-dependent dehydrogenase